MSSDKRDIENVQVFVSHLAECKYSGVLNVTFFKGSVTSISRKEEFNPEGLDRFLRRPVLVRKKTAPADQTAAEPEPAEPAEPTTSEDSPTT